ncbi:hypothetical protein RH831_08900 [Halodesulfurarchaeum sp. HSR-GB]|uniref:hypothetical protein n=1 Tax=Halodesulfurarchaeum sp. HSR-GB TaxID=3074077 RepID=UPI0028629C6F|nr:hypothetical protein [Halodesulfurarchaeum sp. HSR-GB]MDR5657297.1 hypothetical protein [Halodesulfurarchaeum sp. HSR-GB]
MSEEVDGGVEQLFAAYEAALNPYAEVDCALSKWESDKGTFTIEMGNFSDGLWLNVASFGSSISATDFADSWPKEIKDQGHGYVVLKPKSSDPDGLTSETLQVASFVDGDLIDIEMKNIENLPDWFPESLKKWVYKGQRGEQA